MQDRNPYFQFPRKNVYFKQQLYLSASSKEWETTVGQGKNHGACLLDFANPQWEGAPQLAPLPWAPGTDY